jgi:integrase
MNSITSPELIAQINKDNINLKNDFLNYMRATHKSLGTINSYDSDLNIFFVWVLQNANNKRFIDINKRDIIAYQNWLIYDNGNSSARVRRLKAAISSLSNYCENILADDDPEYKDFRSIVRKIENPPMQAAREKTVWEEEELDELLAKLTDKKQYEKACYLALAMCSGRRKAELCRFKVSDFNDDKLVCGNALYKSSPIKTKGRGGGKMICCYTLAKKFKPYLDAWIKERRELGIDSEWLFPNRSNPSEHIPISTANSWAETYTRLSGKESYIHSLRHYFTTSLARAGIPDGVIQSIINWSSADMVRLYKDIDADEEIGMYFKDGDISVPDKKGLNDL